MSCWKTDVFFYCNRSSHHIPVNFKDKKQTLYIYIGSRVKLLDASKLPITSLLMQIGTDTLENLNSICEVSSIQSSVPQSYLRFVKS